MTAPYVRFVLSEVMARQGVRSLSQRGKAKARTAKERGECLIALREGELIPTGVLRTTTPTPAEHLVRLEVYYVLRTYDHKPTLSNASLTEHLLLLGSAH